MKGKAGYIIGAIIVFLVGILVGELAGGGLSKRGMTLKGGMTLEAKLAELDQKLGDLQAGAKGGGGQLQEGKEYKFDIEKSPVLGNPKAKVKLVVFSDLQCPFCEKTEAVLEELVRSNPDKYALYFKTKIIHEGAVLEHEAAYSAQAQGKFWELSDLFFSNRAEMIKISGEGEDPLKTKIYELAGQAGVNIDELKADLESHKYLPQIEAEDKEAKANSINSTPSVFINGYFYGYNPADIKAKAMELLEKPEAPKAEAKAEGLEAKFADIDKKLEDLKAAMAQRQKPQAPQGPEQGKLFSFDLSGAPVLGPKDAKVKLVVFSDFQCPYCERMAKFLEDLQKQNPGQVAIIYKNFVVHPTAGVEHQAAMAAASQGKFWQMHDLLFSNRDSLVQLGGQGPDKLKEKLMEFAKQIGLNASQFQKDLDNNAYDEVLKANMEEGRKAGITGTPSVFVNGYFYGYSPDALKTKVEEEIKK